MQYIREAAETVILNGRAIKTRGGGRGPAIKEKITLKKFNKPCGTAIKKKMRLPLRLTEKNISKAAIIKVHN